MDLKIYLKEKRSLINRQLDEYLKNDPDHPLQEIFHYAFVGGKRFRPILIIASTEACKGNGLAAIPAAIAMEMIHNFSLIHDDLPCMDNDDYRRERETCHKKFGETNALLAGDALLIYAFNILTGQKEGYPVSPESRLRLMELYSRASGHQGMTGGQVLDMEFQDKEEISKDQLLQIHTRKTGALITASTTAGGIVAGASEEIIDRLRIYGEKIGLTYQIIDDLLDMDTDPSSISFPAVYGVEQSKEIAKESTNEAIKALEIFDESAEPLRLIADYLLNREK